MNTATPRTDAAVKLTFAAIRELNRLLRFCAERPGGAVMSQRMEGAADARHAIRKEIRERIRELERAPAARAEKAEAELAAERARLDWVFQNGKVTADDYTTGNRDVYAIHNREDLGAAMKEDAK